MNKRIMIIGASLVLCLCSSCSINISIKTTKVTFALNNGKKDIVTYYNAGEKIDVPLGITKNGYEFECWKIGDEIFDSDSYYLTSNAIVIEAKWKIRHYEINYDLKGGKMPENYLKTYTVLDDFLLPEPQKDGFIFEFWKDQNDYICLQIEEGTTGDLYLTAIWKNA